MIMYRWTCMFDFVHIMYRYYVYMQDDYVYTYT